MMECNSKLEAARRLRGWTLEVASQKIGVHPRTLRRWETGQSKPQGFRVFKISEVYETTPTALGIGITHPQVLDAGSDPLPEDHDELLTHIVEPLLTTDDLDLHLMGLILQRKLDRQNLDYQVFQQQMDQCIREHDEYRQAQPSGCSMDSVRSQALRVVASIPLAAYLENLSPQRLPAPPEDILTHCAGALTACWHMTQGDDLALVRSFISGYLILLNEIFVRATHCRRAAAELIAQACLLKTILLLRIDGPQAGVNYYARALEFSRLADYTEVSDTFSTPLANRSNYGKQPAQVLQKMAEAVWLLKPVPLPPDYPLIHGYLQKMSSFYQIIAVGGQRTSDGPEAEPLELYRFLPALDYAEAALNLWPGIAFHELSEYARALDNSQQSFSEECEGHISEQVRLEFLSNRALASLRLHDMDQSVAAFRATIPQAFLVKSEQKLLEVREAYHLLQFLQTSDISTVDEAELRDLLKRHD